MKYKVTSVSCIYQRSPKTIFKHIHDSCSQGKMIEIENKEKEKEIMPLNPTWNYISLLFFST